VHLAAHVGFDCVVLDPEHDLDGATTVRTAREAASTTAPTSSSPTTTGPSSATCSPRSSAPHALGGRHGQPRAHRAARRGLAERGVAPEVVARVHRPIGLDIGSRSPAEIAVSTVAGLLADRTAGRRGLHGVRVVSLAGGIGGARFLRGLQAAVPDAELTVVVNTGDDITMYGLRICPDLDTVMYTLGGGIDEARGWGRLDETFHAREELQAYDVPTAWFGLGDRDLATHLVRRQMLDAGYPLSQVTAALCARWSPGARLLPMSDDRVETHVRVTLDGGEKVLHFQEWWVRYRAALPASAIVAVGAEAATPAPGVLEAIADADLVVLPPSNPVVSIGTVLQVPGIAQALRARPVVGLSPIVGGAPVRAWRTPASPPSASRRAPRRWGATTAPAARPACSTGGWSTRPTPARRCPASRCAPSRC
jgi:LPPG:FO 2-phospho-L-lactate transferase